jgi:cation diffusion facilitator family transporter
MNSVAVELPNSSQVGVVADESKGTVLLALSMNAVIAVAKFIGGFFTGSNALLSEGAHSVADTLNEVFLLTSLKRSARPADADHPFGYGKERFFWSLLAAVGIFVAGAGFSFIEAYEAFTTTENESGGFFIAYIILGLSFIAEGTSWLRAMRQTRREAREAGRSILEYVRISSDPTVKTVASEDSAALIGLVIAFVGIALHQITGHGYWEGISALCIGALLVFVAYALGRDTKGLLIGEAAVPEVRDGVRRLLEERSEVDAVVDLLTMRIGTRQVLLAARIDLARHLDSDQVERVSAELDMEIQEKFPQVVQVFLDATRSDERKRMRRIMAAESNTH